MRQGVARLANRKGADRQNHRPPLMQMILTAANRMKLTLNRADVTPLTIHTDGERMLPRWQMPC
jgi:hypothetical protein